MSFFKKIKVPESGQSLKNDLLSEEKKGAKISIDLYETEESLVVQSTIAGVRAKDLEISMEKDILIIKGERGKPDGDVPGKKYLYQECYWGPFSRKLILPENIDPFRIQAAVKDGILTVTIPKIEKEKRKNIEIRQED